MANNEKNKSAAGVAALALVFVAFVFIIATSIAAGFAFGAVWGLLALAAWALLAALVLVRAICKLVGERDDG